MALVISLEIEAKIGRDDHGNVTRKEVEECLENHLGGYAIDKRPEHQTESGEPTFWFVAKTNHQRELKITFVWQHGNVYLKSAYPATEKVMKLFKGVGKHPCP
jgi:hypothetical protein